MTNKQERYFVCSESELERLRMTVEIEMTIAGIGNSVSNAYENRLKAEAACRARRVVEDAQGNWVEVGK